MGKKEEVEEVEEVEIAETVEDPTEELIARKEQERKDALVAAAK